jgi:hypothetical protein
VRQNSLGTHQPGNPLIRYIKECVRTAWALINQVIR